MELLKVAPSAPLATYVEYFWTLQCLRDDVLPLRMFANKASGVIVQHYDGRSVLHGANGDPSSSASNPPAVFVYGKRTRPGQLVATGPFELTGVVFRPQALRSLLKIGASEVNNGPVDVDEVLGARLAGRLLDATSAAERRMLLAQALCARVPDADDRLVTQSLRLLHRHRVTLRIPRLLKALGVSERQLERRFVRAVGVSPHHYLRILRFQEGVRLLRLRRFERLSDLACELNYADQSHFIKDTREFSGYTPRNLSETIRTALDLPCALILAAPRNGGIPVLRDRRSA
jgi:AraC-like DNA-binding protein